MAGAPDNETKPGTHGPSRVRRLAWLGGGATGGALLLFGFLLVLGLSWLAAQASHESFPEPGPVAAATPDSGVALPGDRASLPPSVRRYLEQTIYPPGHGRLDASHVDLLTPNRRFEDDRPIPETFSLDASQIVTVRLTGDRYYYEGDTPIPLTLEVLRGDAPIELISLDAGVTREGRGGIEGNRSSLRFTPSGEGFEAILDPARFADHHGPLLVDAQIEYEPGVFHEETMRLFLTPEGRIPARFTGEVDDEVVNGSLRIHVGIEVDQPGVYRIDANLYDRHGRPLAFSAFKGRLDRRDRVVPVDFFGRILRDAGASGPYAVGQIRGYRFLDGEYPDRERIPDLDRRHRTEEYALGQFSADEFMSAHKAQMLDLLMEDAARGIAIDPPPIARPTTAGSGSVEAASTNTEI